MEDKEENKQEDSACAFLDTAMNNWERTNRDTKSKIGPQQTMEKGKQKSNLGTFVFVMEAQKKKK